MGVGMTAAHKALLKQGEFKLVGQGYWWNMLSGCQCAAHSAYAEARLQRCSDIMVQNACHNVAASDNTMRMMPIVNNKKLCAFIDTSFSSLSMKKPERVGNTWVCKDPSAPQLCGNDTLSIHVVNCIPKESRCPLTSVHWDTNQELITGRDPASGKPIIDLRLSEKGRPCVHWNTDYNAFTNKTRPLLFPPAYNQGCPNIEIDGKTFNTSLLYEPVKGFLLTNEKALLIANSYSQHATYPK